MDTPNSRKWCGFSKFLREIDLATCSLEQKPSLERVPENTKYHLGDVTAGLSSLDDAMDIMDEIRLFAKHGILISLGSQQETT